MSDRKWVALVVAAIVLFANMAMLDRSQAASFIEATGVAAEAGDHLWRLMGVSLLALVAGVALAAFMRKGAK